MKTNADCTLYSKGVVNGAESWTRQVILDVFWENRKAANVITSGLLEADSVSVYVPMARGALVFKPGDVLVKGKITNEISAGFTISDLKKAHADVVVIRSVDRKDFGSLHMRHWQIGAA